MTSQFHEMPPGYIGPPVLGHASSTVLDAGISGPYSSFVPPPEPSFTRSAWVSIIAEAIRVAGCNWCNRTGKFSSGTYIDHDCLLAGRRVYNSEDCCGECTCTCGRAGGRAKIAKSP